ncbi:MAG: DUF805 domain-containing protein [Asticcacaulis sp.]
MKGLAFFFDVFGRTRRRDFWLFTVGLFAFYALALGSGALGSGDVRGHAAFYGQLPLTVLQAMLSTDYGFIAFAILQVVTVAVLIRRCHDRNLSASDCWPRWCRSWGGCGCSWNWD